MDMHNLIYNNLNEKNYSVLLQNNLTLIFRVDECRMLVETVYQIIYL